MKKVTAFTFWLILTLLAVCQVTSVPVYAQKPTTDQLSLHFRADTLTTLYPGYQYVTAWKDVSAKGYSMVQTSGFPVLNATAMNKKPGLVYDGTIYYILPTGVHELTNSDFELFVVMKTSSSTTQFLFSGNGVEGFSLNNSSGIRYSNGTSTLTSGSLNAYSDGKMKIVNLQASSTGGTLRINGVAVASTSGDCRFSSSNLYLSMQNNTTNRFRGTISEILIYKKNLEAQEREDIVAWISKKYNLQTPETQVSNLSVTADNPSLIYGSVTEGSGTRRIILGKKGSPITAEPSDNITYPDNYTFPDGSIVLFNNTGTNFFHHNLDFNSTYYYKAFEYNGENGSEKYLLTGAPEVSATTPFYDPYVHITGITLTSLTSVRINFDLNANGDSTLWKVAYGTDYSNLADTVYGGKEFTEFDTDDLHLEREITGLSPGQTYNFAVVATNQGGTVKATSSKDLDVSPIAGIIDINSPSGDSVKVISSINPNGFETTYFISYGLDPYSMTTQTEGFSAGSGAGYSEFENYIHGIQQGHLYYIEVRAANAGGERFSAVFEYFADTTIIRSGLTFWLDAGRGIQEVQNEDPVSYWSASYGSSFSNEGSESSPVFLSQGMNNQPGVQFSAGDFLESSALANYGLGENNLDIWLVFQSGSSGEEVLLTSDAGLIKLNSGMHGIEYKSKTLSTSAGRGIPGQFSDGLPHLVNVVLTSTGVSLRVDGAELATAEGDFRFFYPEYPINTRFGYNDTTGFTGTLSEFLIYNRELTSAERIAIQLQLGEKYTIQAETLPVELTTFTGVVNGSSVLLNWSTSSEENNYGWEIQRRSAEPEALEGSASNISNQDPSRTSGSGLEWESIGFVAGKGTTTRQNSYSFMAPLTHQKTSYRLRQIDLDGSFTYSQIVSIDGVPGKFDLSQNYPNPFNPETRISFSLAESGPAKLVLMDILGREVAVLKNERLEAGTHILMFNGSSLASGTYFLRLTSSGNSQVRKMVLMK